jgi:hypothetical protein
MKVYHFPSSSVNRLVREAIYGHYLRLLKYPDPSRPSSKLDPKTMPWAELQGLILSHLRHRYTDYEAALARGEDRDLLHRAITADAFYAYPWLRRDPRPFPVDPPRLALDEAAAHLATLTDLKHGLLEARGSPGGRTYREKIREMLGRVETNIKELNTILTQQRVREDSVMGIYRRVLTPGDYDWLGHSLRPNHLAYAGFKCPGCGEGVYLSKRAIAIGQGQRAVVHSCVCVTHFTPDSTQKLEPMTFEKWSGYVNRLRTEKEETAS